MEQESLHSLHKKYIKGTEPKAIVVYKKILLCNLTKTVQRSCGFSSGAVYITTIILKHLYDKKPAEWYDFIINNLIEIVKYPNHIYKNRSEKTGNFCLVKTLKNKKYLCSIEICADEQEKPEIYIVTVFRTDDKYLEKYELLWSWRDDAPSS